MKGRETAEAYCEVLNHVSSIIVHPSQPKKQQLVVLSKQVAVSVSELVKQAELLKGCVLCFFLKLSVLILLTCVEENSLKRRQMPSNQTGGTYSICL